MPDLVAALAVIAASTAGLTGCRPIDTGSIYCCLLAAVADGCDHPNSTRQLKEKVAWWRLVAWEGDPRACQETLATDGPGCSTPSGSEAFTLEDARAVCTAEPF